MYDFCSGSTVPEVVIPSEPVVSPLTYKALSLMHNNYNYALYLRDDTALSTTYIYILTP